MIIASIDIGSNTIILLIAEVDLKNLNIVSLYNEQRIPRIGHKLINGNPISDEKINELLTVLKDYNSVIKKFKCEQVIATATNAFRIASNQNELRELIKKRFNFDVDIVSGDAEAELTFLGAVYSHNHTSNCIVIDIGGGSTEIIAGSVNHISYKKSFEAGVVSIKEKLLKHSPPLKIEISRISGELNQIFGELNSREFEFEKAIAIAGTPTTLAAMKLNMEVYDEELLEGQILDLKEIGFFINELSSLNEKRIMEKYKSIGKGREDVILTGALILYHLMDRLVIDKVVVSTKGIRYGAIYKKIIAF